MPIKELSLEILIARSVMRVSSASQKRAKGVHRGLDIQVDIVLVILSARSAVTFHATDEKTVITQSMIRDEQNVALRIHISSLATSSVSSPVLYIAEFHRTRSECGPIATPHTIQLYILQKFDINASILATAIKSLFIVSFNFNNNFHNLYFFVSFFLLRMKINASHIHILQIHGINDYYNF